MAVSDKGSLTELPWLSASTPIGFTFVVRLCLPGGQLQRFLPLAFLAGSVVAGYGFGRVLGWPARRWSILAGALGAAAALLLPAQQLRHDLKQYTADACLAVLLFALLAWAESAWSPARGGVLGGVIVVGMLFSHPAALVGSAALGALLVVAVWTRAWSRVCGLVALFVLTGLGMGFVYLAVDRPAHNERLSTYWADFFPTASAMPHFVVKRLDQLRPVLGMPWQLFLVLAGIGVLTVARLGRPATAVALVLLPVAAALAGLSGMYPLLDQRTSHFLLVTGAVLGGVAVAGVAYFVGERGRTAVGVGLVALTLVGFMAANREWLRYPERSAGAGEDVCSQVSYVAEHRRSGDVILVNLSGGYGFAYYWSADAPQFRRGDVQDTGWYVAYPPASRIVIAAGRDQSSVNQALREAEVIAGGGGRVWLVRTHVLADEANVWRNALAGRRMQTIRTGSEPLALLLE